MTSLFFFNAFVLLVFAVLIVYSVYLVAHGQWDKGTYFLVMAVFIFSNFIERTRAIRP